MERPTYLDMLKKQQKAEVTLDLHARALERAMRPMLRKLLQRIREEDDKLTPPPVSSPSP